MYHVLVRFEFWCKSKAQMTPKYTTVTQDYIFYIKCAFRYVTNEYFSQDTRNKQCQGLLFNFAIVTINVTRHQYA